MSKNIINDKRALDSLISKSISPTLKHVLDEAPIAPVQQAAPAPTAPPPPQPPPGDGVNQVSVSKVATGAAGTTDAQELQKGSITIEMVVEKLNSIRSGRSFKDENILGQMSTYFQDLNDNEKLALYAFLKGIAQIVTGELQNTQQATNPQAVEMEVTDRGDGMKDVRHVKPNIIKKTTPSAPAPSRENTSAPSPIVPKQR